MSRFTVLLSLFAGAAAVSKLSELSKMSQEEVDSLFAALLPEFDSNADGFISTDEIVAHNERKFLQTLKVAATNEFANLDTDKDGKISPAELAASISADVKSEDLLKRFNRSDKDQDGFLDIDEVVAIMMGSDMDDSVYTEFLSTHDTNSDGKLTAEELLSSFTDEERKESGADVKEAFTFADEDKDGFLSVKEVKVLLDAASQGSAASADQRKVYFAEEAKQILSGDEKMPIEKFDRKSKMVLLAELFTEDDQEKVTKEAAPAEGIPSELEQDILKFQKEMMAAGETDPSLDPASDSFDVEKFLAELKNLVDQGGNSDMLVLDENEKVMGNLNNLSGEQLVGDALKEAGVKASKKEDSKSDNTKTESPEVEGQRDEL